MCDTGQIVYYEVFELWSQLHMYIIFEFYLVYTSSGILFHKYAC